MMRIAGFAFALALGTAAIAVHAQDPSSPSKPYPVDTVKCNDGTSALRPIKPSTCSDHGGVATPPASSSNNASASDASPAAEAPPKGATAHCKDGTYSKSKSHSGACSRHGGVEKWL